MRRPLHWLPAGAAALAALAALCMLALLVLWPRSYHLGGYETVLEAPGGSLHIASRDGRIAIGVYRPRRYTYMFWGAPPPANMQSLLVDQAKFGYADLLGWGIAVPHWLLAAVIGIVPAWWWFIYRQRLERQRRRAQGLCRECGYDLRAARERCPECGTPIGGAKLERAPAPLPAFSLLPPEKR